MRDLPFLQVSIAYILEFAVLSLLRDGVDGCAKKEHTIVDKATTMRRHMAACHPHVYRKWAKAEKFDSMLPNNTTKRRKSIADQLLQQTSDDNHFKPATAEEKPIPYSDKIFKEAAIEWLIETNQPIQAFKHPKFQKMVSIAARSTRGVKFPLRKQTRQEIIKQFKEQMKALKERLNVSSILLLFSHYLFLYVESCRQGRNQSH
ncbi:hypothetical protein B0H34DRAFT_852330 [Crassisporium funariophilum]|nr:hypothetical protein B0H34DRAFT_852330 [Crassisporium funariophilum]